MRLGLNTSDEPLSQDTDPSSSPGGAGEVVQSQAAHSEIGHPAGLGILTSTAAVRKVAPPQIGDAPRTPEARGRSSLKHRPRPAQPSRLSREPPIRCPFPHPRAPRVARPGGQRPAVVCGAGRAGSAAWRVFAFPPRRPTIDSHLYSGFPRLELTTITTGRGGAGAHAHSLSVNCR